MSTYVSMSRLSVDPDLTGELVQAFNDRAHLVDSADGFIRLEVSPGAGAAADYGRGARSRMIDTGSSRSCSRATTSIT